MYDFSYLLEKQEAHDVVFKAADGSSAGFCKNLLLGLSDVWRTRDEGEQVAAEWLLTTAAAAVRLADHWRDFGSLLFLSVPCLVMYGRLRLCRHVRCSRSL